MFKSQIRLIAEPMLRVRLFHHHNILNSDSKTTLFVIAWLIGNDVSWGKGDFGILDPGADSDGSFVHVKKRTNAMARAMAVV